jgi:hypothetical protein
VEVGLNEQMVKNQDHHLATRQGSLSSGEHQSAVETDGYKHGALEYGRRWETILLLSRDTRRIYDLIRTFVFVWSVLDAFVC